MADTGGGAIWRADAGLNQTGNTFTSNQPAGDDVKMATYQVEVEKRLASGAPKAASKNGDSSVVLLAAVGGASIVIVVLVFVILTTRRRRRRAAAP